MFDIDVLGLKALALDEAQKQFLLALALWKIGAFLSNKPAFDARSRQTSPSLRLRADCYLSCCDTVQWSSPPGDDTPVKVAELCGALPEHKPEFEKLAQEQDFTFKKEEDGKRLAVRVTYRKSMGAQSAALGQAQETLQANDAPSMED
jgi:hypothetical protein